MLTEALLFVGGLALLIAGADRVVTSAAELALYYGVSTFFIGVTAVAVGTSIPEITTSILAARMGAGDLVVGNIVGSETAQITLAVGVVALVAPVVAERRNVAIYGGAVMLSMVVMVLTLEDGRIVRSEGVLMMLAYAMFLHDLYTSEGGAEVGEEIADEREPPRATVPWIVLGLGMVVVGGHLMVTGGVALARLVGVSEYLVGLLTGLGTTVPEIVVAGVAARHGDAGISVGSLLGSNITDPVFSLGAGAIVADVVVTDLPGVTTSLTYMLVVSAGVLGVVYWRRGVDRRLAVVCLALYLPTFALG
ncbi:MAG: sodium:calcium antiporter [Halobacteriaceae archaeon]